MRFRGKRAGTDRSFFVDVGVLSRGRFRAAGQTASLRECARRFSGR